MSEATDPRISSEQIQALFDASPFIAFLGLRVIGLDYDKSEFSARMPLKPELERRLGTRQFHGGPIASFIDVVGDFAIGMLACGGVPTMNLRIDYVRPAIGDALIVPDRYEQLVRYVGWYSSRSRGARKAKGATAVATTASGVIEVLGEYASRAKAAWARLIRKVYEADPLVCPRCQGPMRVIALIEDPAVVRAIPTHLGLWQPQALERAPPAPARAWPEHANLPLTYHPLPDIA